MSLLDDVYALIAPRSRAIGTIIPGVVIEEAHQDDTAITLHPVEIGAAISDHAFLLPARVEMRCGWSDSAAGTEGYVQAVYQQLLALRATREVFDVFTGKRFYPDMLIRSLNVVTDHKTEHALMVTVGLQQVLITSTRGGGASSASNAAQALPQVTGNVQQGGTRQLLDAGTQLGLGSIG